MNRYVYILIKKMYIKSNLLLRLYFYTFPIATFNEINNIQISNNVFAIRLESYIFLKYYVGRSSCLLALLSINAQYLQEE
jgi:hypothetical protein